MFPKAKVQKNRALLSTVCLILAIAVSFSGCTPKPEAQGQKTSQIPNTGKQIGMPARAADAYSARMTGIASSAEGMNRQAIRAYGARMTGMAGPRRGMSARAKDAYKARMTGLDIVRMGILNRAQEADAERWNGMAKYYQVP